LNFDFECFFEEIIGPREHFHTMECHVCGFDEVYFQHPLTKIQIGFACEGCYFAYVFTFEQVNSHSKTFKEINQNQKHLQSDQLLCDYGRV